MIRSDHSMYPMVWENKKIILYTLPTRIGAVVMFPKSVSRVDPFPLMETHGKPSFSPGNLKPYKRSLKFCVCSPGIVLNLGFHKIIMSLNLASIATFLTAVFFYPIAIVHKSRAIHFVSKPFEQHSDNNENNTILLIFRFSSLLFYFIFILF